MENGKIKKDVLKSVDGEKTSTNKNKCLKVKSKKDSPQDVSGNIGINVKDLVLTIKGNKILKKIAFNIKPGERVALIGANGAGKTTLVEIIAGIREMDSGEIIYSNGNMRDFKKRLGVQFQESKYPHDVTVETAIKLYTESFGLNINGEDIQTKLEVFELKRLLKRKVASLSGGQQQRLNVFLSIINNPKFLILDELSTGLDLETRIRLQEFIQTYIVKNNTTLLFVTHNMDEIEALCKRVILISFGKVYLDTKVSTLIKKHGSLLNFMINHLKETAPERETLKIKRGEK